jgi:hypothetical protein
MNLKISKCILNCNEETLINYGASMGLIFQPYRHITMVVSIIKGIYNE